MSNDTISYLFTDRYANTGISAVVWHFIHDQRPIRLRLPFAVDFLKVSIFFKRVDTAQLSRENLSSLCSSCCQNLSSSLCAHSCTETMNLCMGSLLWLKCHLHNKTPPCFSVLFSNLYCCFLGCTRRCGFAAFLAPLQKLDIIRIILRNRRFVKFFFQFLSQSFKKNLSPTYPQSYPPFFYPRGLWIKVIPKLWITHHCLGITMWIFQKMLLKPLILRQTFFCG